MRSVLISFEGCDGAGKSTVASEIHEALSRLGKKTKLIRPKKVTFVDSRVQSHMQVLASILWEPPDVNTMPKLSDMHWLHLAAAWFETVDQVIVRPSLGEFDFVILDSWIHKLLVRFSLKGADVTAEAQRCFASLSVPDFTILLDIDPEIAADRKINFGISESGNLDGLVGRTRENFVRYQQNIRSSLLDFGRKQQWIGINVDKIPSNEITRHAFQALTARLQI